MALINCPECGRDKVSDTAIACPTCGFGIKIHFDKLKEEAQRIEQERIAKEQAERKAQEKAERERVEREKRDAAEEQEEITERAEKLASISIPRKYGIGFGCFITIILFFSLFVMCFAFGSGSSLLPSSITQSSVYYSAQTAIFTDNTLQSITAMENQRHILDCCCICFLFLHVALIVIAIHGKKNKNQDFYLYKQIGDSRYRMHKLKESGWVSEVSKRREERRQNELKESLDRKQREQRIKNYIMERISCPKCGRDNISDTAIACPSCGFDVTNHIQKIKAEAMQEEAKRKKAEEDRKFNEQNERTLNTIKKWERSILIAIVLLGLLSFFIPFGGNGSNKCGWCNGTGYSANGATNATEYVFTKKPCTHCNGTGRKK